MKADTLSIDKSFQQSTSRRKILRSIHSEKTIGMMTLDKRAQETITVVSVLVALATIALAMRMCARFRLAVKVGWDDYLCIAALFFLYSMLVELSLCKFCITLANTWLLPTTNYSACVGHLCSRRLFSLEEQYVRLRSLLAMHFLGHNFQEAALKFRCLTRILGTTRGAYGKHLTQVLEESPWEIVDFQKLFVASEFSYLMASGLLRISIVLFYQRFFITQGFWLASTGVMYAVAIWTTIMIIVWGLQCIPLAALWDKTIEGKCINSLVWIIVNQCFNIAIDFILLGLPLPIILNLQRAWKEKLMLSGVFLVGGFVCFAGLYRIVVLFYISETDPTCKYPPQNKSGSTS